MLPSPPPPVSCVASARALLDLHAPAAVPESSCAALPDAADRSAHHPPTRPPPTAAVAGGQAAMDGDKVAQFVSITAASETTASFYLDSCGGAVDAARRRTHTRHVLAADH